VKCLVPAQGDGTRPNEVSAAIPGDAVAGNKRFERGALSAIHLWLHNKKNSREAYVINILLIVAIVLLVVAVALMVMLLKKVSQADASVLAPRLDAFEKAQERTERVVREEVAQSRDEIGKADREQRQELNEAFKTFGDSVVQRMMEVANIQKGQLDAFSGQLSSFAKASGERLDGVRVESATGAKQLREEVVVTLKALSETITKTMGELANVQKGQLDTFSGQLDSFSKASSERLDGARTESATGAKQLREEVVATLKTLSETITNTMGEMANTQKGQLIAFSDQLGSFAKTSGEKLDGVRVESATGGKQLREEVVGTLKSLSETMTKTMGEIANVQKGQLEAFSDQLGSFAKASGEKLDGVRVESANGGKQLREEVVTTLKSISETMVKTMKDLSIAEKAQLEAFSGQIASLTKTSGEKLDGIRTESATGAKQLREEVIAALKGITEATTKTMGELANLQKVQLEAMSSAIGKLSDSNEKKLEAVRVAVEGKLQSIQNDNAKQLEKMRQTVDEKLQGTLEKRLGESFKHVSERLELVHKGLGEMQSLATGVGDLKKVLTNVKTRGTWGEVQLGALLEQVLNPDQFSSNVAIKDGGERVEFVVKLPGQSSDKDETVLLPIDAKFPIEDYQRLIESQERADIEGVELAGKQLENRVKACAGDICKKYLSPPKTTDFGILFLPIEGLFAEVIRRTGLTEAIQRDCRIVIAGPTTLWSILSSLQMGFRTLAIQKRSSEVWNLLAAVKTEWTKYGDVLDLVQKKLHQATDTIEKAQVRSRAVGRKLKDVQELPAGEAIALLPIDVQADDEMDDENNDDRG
jgi:DNA recombination protein RmuC